MRIAVVAQSPTFANEALAAPGMTAPDWSVMTPAEALATLSAGDAAIGRIDVLPTLDGVDDGLWVLGALAARGVTVLNDASALLAAHDKLLTARLLRRAGLPHPRTRLIAGDRPVSPLRAPVVVKPRFGSWGLGVERCDDEASLAKLLAQLPHEPWYRAHGALVQELVPPLGFDLRIVVAHDHVIGAISRVAAPGEWRTNIALGAERRMVTPPPDACALALAAARATGAALVGVDLLPDGSGRFTVAEINGAVEFNVEYALRPGADPFAEAAFRLAGAAICARVGEPAHAALVLQA
jgi:Glutathione synthase/Ribosomal protein S6 modification enzyme (glutaminyl transferase)